MKKRAVIALTEGGVRLAKVICRNMDCTIYTLKKYADGNRLFNIEPNLRVFMGYVFSAYDEIIMIMACGIAVRSISAHLNSKLSDPAIVVLDEMGRHVISLISGHIGGANRLATEVARITGGTEVITTASDILGLEAVDSLAQRLELEIDDYTQAKEVTACLVNGKRTGVYSEIEGLVANDHLIMLKEVDKLNSYLLDALIYIGSRNVSRLGKLQIPAVRLFRKNLVIGIGCKKNTGYEKIINALTKVFKDIDYSLKAIRTIATIELKRHEKGILKLSESLEIPVKIIDIQKINEVEHLFECSQIVRDVTGVGCICQPAAYIESGRGKCILPKTCIDGVAISIYETN